MKSGIINFLEPSGPVQARNGIALPLRFEKKLTFYISASCRAASYNKLLSSLDDLSCWSSPPPPPGVTKNIDSISINFMLSFPRKTYNHKNSSRISVAANYHLSYLLLHVSTIVKWTQVNGAQHTMLADRHFVTHISHKTQLQISQCSVIFPNIHDSTRQGCTYSGRQAAVATTFCTVAPNICESSVLNLLQITLLASENSEVSSTFLDKPVHPWRKLCRAYSSL
jgi:hypothetical protein